MKSFYDLSGGDSDVDSEARSEFRNQLSTLKILPLKDAIMSAFSMESPTKEMESKVSYLCLISHKRN